MLELSHALYQGRKRRCEWEIHADHHIRRRKDTEVQGGGPIQAPATEGLPKDCNLAEIKYLQACLRQSGLTPRAPDAEMAFLNLVSAAALTIKAPPVLEFEGTDFEWMTSMDTKLAAATHVSEAPIIEDLYVDLSSSSQHVVAQCGACVSEQPSIEEDLRVAFEHANLVQEMRLPEALQRLQIFLKAHQYSACCVSSAPREDDEEAEALRETIREAMIEAERQELAKMLNKWRDESMSPCNDNDEFAAELQKQHSMSRSPDPSAYPPSMASAKVTPGLAPEKVLCKPGDLKEAECEDLMTAVTK